LEHLDGVLGSRLVDYLQRRYSARGVAITLRAYPAMED
jgi:hypothetical protein